MIDYTKEELVELLRKNPEKFNAWKVEQEEVDLSEVDFSGIKAGTNFRIEAKMEVDMDNNVTYRASSSLF